MKRPDMAGQFKHKAFGPPPLPSRLFFCDFGPHTLDPTVTQRAAQRSAAQRDSKREGGGGGRGEGGGGKSWRSGGKGGGY